MSFISCPICKRANVPTGIGHSGSGTLPVTTVPESDERMFSSPPTATRRSRMLLSPAPPFMGWPVEASAVVTHLEPQGAALLQRDRDLARSTCVLRRVLHRLEAAE